MKKFILVLCMSAFLSVNVAEARGYRNPQPHNPPRQQVIVNNYNYNQGRRHDNYDRHHRRQQQPVYYYNNHKRDKTAEVIAISLGVVGTTAILASVLR